MGCDEAADGRAGGGLAGRNPGCGAKAVGDTLGLGGGAARTVVRVDCATAGAGTGLGADAMGGVSNLGGGAIAGAGGGGSGCEEVGGGAKGCAEILDRGGRAGAA